MLRRKSIVLSLISLTMVSGGLVLGQTTQATTPSPQVTQTEKPPDAANQATGTIPAQSEPVT
ncbi:hypothetical protein ABTN12_19685, partial [Acinetobacter baumannii]